MVASSEGNENDVSPVLKTDPGVAGLAGILTDKGNEPTPDTEDSSSQEGTEETEGEGQPEEPEGEGEGDGEEEEADAGPDDVIEVDVEGTIYKVPKSLEPHIMRNADYTQKSQALAEDRRKHSDAITNFNEMMQVQQEMMEDIVSIKALDKQLEQFKDIDWDRWSQQSPKETQRAWIEFQQLRDQRVALVTELDQKAAGKQQEYAKQRSVRQQETVEALKASDPDFGWPGYSPQVMQYVTKAATAIGIPPEEQRRILSPVAIKVLHGFIKYRESLLAARKPKTVQRVSTQAAQNGNGQQPTHQKLPRRLSGTKAPIDPDKMTMDQFVKTETARMKRLGIVRY